MYEPVLPIALEEFVFAMEVADRAAAGQIPSEALLEMLSATGPGIRPTDCPESRAAFAVMDAFADRDEDFRSSVLWRLFQLDDLLKTKASARFIEPADGGWNLSKPFLHAVATCKMTHGKKTKDSDFRKALRDAAALYPVGETED
jgi:hypothetical protein